MSVEPMRYGVKWAAERALDPFLYAPGMGKVALATVLERIGISWDTLSWCALHPEEVENLIKRSKAQ